MMQNLASSLSPKTFMKQSSDLALDKAAVAAEDNAFLRRYFHNNARRFYETLLSVQYCVANKKKSVIWDIGAYPGTFLRLFHHFVPEATLFGFGSMMPEAFTRSMEDIDVQMFEMDIDPPYALIIKKTVPPSFFFDDSLSAPDVVVMGEILEHLFFPQHVLSEVFRKLRPGGAVVLTTPNITVRDKFNILFNKQGIPPLAESHISKLYEFRGHVRIYCERDLVTLLTQVGFEIERHQFINLEFSMGWGLPGILKTFLYLFPSLRRDQLIVAIKPEMHC